MFHHLVEKGDSHMALRMYILVNEDIKIGKGKLPGQVGHAVATFFYRAFTTGKQEERELIHQYMGNEQTKILLKCPQSKLEELEKEHYITIRDKGYTHLPPNTLTCVNLGIMDKEMAPSWVQELKLYN